ncbi:kinesin light chain 3-like isoform X2 [Lolium rigidum]|uniref:kinesin light chain 3-like isoform X2 n=1 Tax=Lolium rigidum TaxID=89674 RepID=UPI001F5DCF2D|nr:kinesin light chain 3-like isoform X2 [Lolium rigidum]
MSSRRRLLSLLRSARLAPAGRLAAAPSSRSFSLLPAAAASTSGSGSSDGSFSSKGSKYGAILIGQAAVFLGLSSNALLAQDDSVAPADSSEQADANATGLRRIEDGSVISNEHTIKWRMCTDSARDYFLKGKLAEAEKLFKTALQEAKEGFGLRDPHVASALNNLAEFYRLRKEYEKAEPLYMEAVEILEQSFGPDDIRVGTALRNLGQYYHIQRRFDQAQSCYERALKIEGRVMGLGHPDYANTMYLLAKVLRQQRKGNDAEALIRESIRILEEAGLGESPNCIHRMRFLSLDLVRSKRLVEAENLQRKILHNLELSKGWDSLDTIMAAETLSVTLQTIGELKESEELLERCLAVRRKILSENHFEVAGILVHLARLTLLKIISDVNVSNDLSRSHLVKAKQLVSDSIRITEGILNPLKENQKKLKSTIGIEREKIGATAVLLQALEVVGLLEATRKRKQEPGLVLLLRLPLEHLKHGYFKIDAVRVSHTCRLFIWPDKHLIGVRNTTLRIHLKNNFEKSDYEHAEQALRKCISLYNEPYTRNVVSKYLRQQYERCLNSLVHIIQLDPDILNAPGMQDLLDESQRIMKELGEEKNTK